MILMKQNRNHSKWQHQLAIQFSFIPVPRLYKKDPSLYILLNEYNTVLSLCERKTNKKVFRILHAVFFPPSEIMINTWIARVNQGEQSSYVPLGLKPYQLCSFFLIRLRLLACTSSSFSLSVPTVLKLARVLSLFPRIWSLLAFTHMCIIIR